MSSQEDVGLSIDKAAWSELAKENPIDPYVVWGLQTQFRAYVGPNQSPDIITFAVELNKPFEPCRPFVLQLSSDSTESESANPEDPNEVQICQRLTENTKLDVSPAYDVVFGGSRPKFVTMRMSCGKASAQEREKAIRSLIARSDVKRIQIGYVRKSSDTDMVPSKHPPCAISNISALVGIVEDAGPFAHAALREKPTGNSTRVLAVWNQTERRSSPPAWDSPFHFSYGRQLSQTEMNHALGRHHDGVSLDEEAVYSDPQIRMKELRVRPSHAAAVAGLFAGAWGAAPRMPQTPDPDGVNEAAMSPLEDAASRAPVVLVQLPSDRIRVPSGRWLAVNALDAFHYILDVACAPDAGGVKNCPKVVINMSYGAMASAHDGTGLLEQAVDELIALYEGHGGELAIVLAAGNTSGALRGVEAETENGVDMHFRRSASGMHARANIPQSRTTEFTVFVPNDKQTETYVEFWFNRQLKNETVAITVTAPDGSEWGEVSCNQARFCGRAGETEAGLLFYSNVPQSKERSMALLVVAPTQISSTKIYALAGRWKIKVSHVAPPDSVDLEVEAWVERDDTKSGASRPQAARFVRVNGGDKASLDDANTFSNIATGKSTFCVGALRAINSGADGETPSYSGIGNSNREGPECSAVASIGNSYPGIRVSGSLSGMVMRATGTSLAAPQAARWIFNQLAEENGNLADVRRKVSEERDKDARRGLLIPDPQQARDSP